AVMRIFTTLTTLMLVSGGVLATPVADLPKPTDVLAAHGHAVPKRAPWPFFPFSRSSDHSPSDDEVPASVSRRHPYRRRRPHP
ncbi:hypothetical protein DENSPDRAFT_841165, partial [Dentipellis sp. KUC8613]